MTAADAPNRFEDSSRLLAGNNETQQLTRAILEILKTDMLPLTQAILETLKTDMLPLTKAILETLKTIRIIAEKQQAQGSGTGSALEEQLRSRNAQRRELKTSDNKGGRPPYDEDVKWWFLLAEDLADHDRISQEARFSRLKELCDRHGVDAPGLTTFKNRRNELRQRLGRKGRQ